MSFVLASVDALVSTTADLESIGGTLNAANNAAAFPTSQLDPAAADEISGTLAKLFGHHGQQYQAAAKQAAGCFDRFTRTLLAGANAYVAAESSNLASVASGATTAVNQAVVQVNKVSSSLLDPLGMLFGDGGVGAQQ
ncbi:PE family protein, partial [Mycobacterium sp. ML2]